MSTLCQTPKEEQSVVNREDDTHRTETRCDKEMSGVTILAADEYMAFEVKVTRKKDGLIMSVKKVSPRVLYIVLPES